jgi:hypothetical protein
VKKRVCRNLSTSDERSNTPTVNDFIDKADFPTRFDMAFDVAKMVRARPVPFRSLSFPSTPFPPHASALVTAHRCIRLSRALAPVPAHRCIHLSRASAPVPVHQCIQLVGASALVPAHRCIQSSRASALGPAHRRIQYFFRASTPVPVHQHIQNFSRIGACPCTSAHTNIDSRIGAGSCASAYSSRFTLRLPCPCLCTYANLRTRELHQHHPSHPISMTFFIIKYYVVQHPQLRCVVHAK